MIRDAVSALESNWTPIGAVVLSAVSLAFLHLFSSSFSRGVISFLLALFGHILNFGGNGVEFFFHDGYRIKGLFHLRLSQGPPMA